MLSNLKANTRLGVTRILHDSLGLPRSAKRLIVILMDGALALIAVWLAFYLRLGEWDYLSGNQWLSVGLSLLAIPVFWIFGVYQALFRHVALDAMVGIARACVVYGLIYAAFFLFLGVKDVPRTVGVIQPLIFFCLVASSRIALRSMLGRIGSHGGRPRVMIYGAGQSGRQLASAISDSREMELLGFIDDDRTLQRALMNGKRIYPSDRLASLVERRDVTDILLALPSTTHARRAEILEQLRPLGVNVKTVPGLMDLASGRVQVSSIRELDIGDLLGRDAVDGDELLFSSKIQDKTVLVTGAGGSIGSELCRQIIVAKPKVLILVEQTEYALYTIENELRNLVTNDNQTKIVPLLASVRNRQRMASIFSTWNPDTVYHAAAYKHVPMVEKNISEGVWNNVFGTYWTAISAIENGVKDFVLISTDKAVRPTNVMGTTKRLAEMSLQALADTKCFTRFSMVRFGNVLGSSGSVVPLFHSQIARGGPVTITHPEVTRYFMTIPEAAQLVIQAGAMAEGGEVFILDMGEPVRIVDLARQMIELSGATVRDEARPHGEIAIEVVGLRPGEKLYEELLIGDNPVPTSHPLIMKSHEVFIPLNELGQLLDQLNEALSRSDVVAVHALLCKAVPEFSSPDGVIDLVELEGRQSRAAQPHAGSVDPGAAPFPPTAS